MNDLNDSLCQLYDKGVSYGCYKPQAAFQSGGGCEDEYEGWLSSTNGGGPWLAKQFELYNAMYFPEQFHNLVRVANRKRIPSVLTHGKQGSALALGAGNITVTRNFGCDLHNDRDETDTHAFGFWTNWDERMQCIVSHGVSGGEFVWDDVDALVDFSDVLFAQLCSKLRHGTLRSKPDGSVVRLASSMQICQALSERVDSYMSQHVEQEHSAKATAEEGKGQKRKAQEVGHGIGDPDSEVVELRSPSKTAKTSAATTEPELRPRSKTAKATTAEPQPRPRTKTAKATTAEPQPRPRSKTAKAATTVEESCSPSKRAKTSATATEPRSTVTQPSLAGWWPSNTTSSRMAPHGSKQNVMKSPSRRRSWIEASGSEFERAGSQDSISSDDMPISAKVGRSSGKTGPGSSGGEGKGKRGKRKRGGEGEGKSSRQTGKKSSSQRKSKLEIIDESEDELKGGKKTKSQRKRRKMADDDFESSDSSSDDAEAEIEGYHVAEDEDEIEEEDEDELEPNFDDHPQYCLLKHKIVETLESRVLVNLTDELWNQYYGSQANTPDKKKKGGGAAKGEKRPRGRPRKENKLDDADKPADGASSSMPEVLAQNPPSKVFVCNKQGVRYQCHVPTCNKDFQNHQGITYHVKNHVHEIINFLAWAYPNESSPSNNDAGPEDAKEPNPDTIRADIRELYEAVPEEAFPLVFDEYKVILPGQARPASLPLLLGYSRERKQAASKRQEAQAQKETKERKEKKAEEPKERKPRKTRTPAAKGKIVHLPSLEEEEFPPSPSQSGKTAPAAAASRSKRGKGMRDKLLLSAKPVPDLVDSDAEGDENIQVVYEGLRPRLEEFEVVDDDEALAHTPPYLGCAVASGTKNDMKPAIYLGTFTSCSLNSKRKVFVLNAGSSIWGMDWVPGIGPDGVQYLAVAGYKRTTDEHHVIGARQQAEDEDDPGMKGCIQIWSMAGVYDEAETKKRRRSNKSDDDDDFDDSDNEQDDSNVPPQHQNMPMLELCILHDFGCVHDLKWCPYGGYEDPTKVCKGK
ncbi:hypothetical protein HK102_013759 [Quaeritorhiza haematococci]|nr:hypothetical protein HK102_013759 [Quaeritorhiza haematococci]